MMRRQAILAAMLMMMAGTASARLCRDSKGLFTPCTGMAPPPEAHRQARVRPIADAQPGADAAEPVRRAGPVRRPLVARTRLCRDSKGLFTPCAR